MWTPRFAAILLFASAAALLSGCAHPARTASDQLVPLRFADERRQCEKRALAGDTQAARRLADYYFVMCHDPERAYHWAEVGASHGDKEAEENMARLNDILEQKWRDRR
jgi:hypothetical protein